MTYSLPTDLVEISFPGLPSGLIATPIGGQIRKTNDTIVVGRTLSGIDEVPAGSGNYVFSVVAPAEEDHYLATLDWNGGVLEPSTSSTVDLYVTATIPGVVSGLGPIADGVASHMGTVFQGLKTSPRYGESFITTRIEVVKRRVLAVPPATIDEDDLDPLIVDYLGKLTALELMPAAFDWLLDQVQSRTAGNEPSETTTYVDRFKVLEKVQQILLDQTRRDEAIVLPIVPDPRQTVSAGPAISEDDDCRVTSDPRHFPPYRRFPRRHDHDRSVW